MKKKKRKKNAARPKNLFRFSLPEETKKYILGLASLILAAIISLSFFEKAGIAGEIIMAVLLFLIGKVVFIMPLILAIAGICLFLSRYKNFLGQVSLATSLLTLGASGIFESLSPGIKQGGYLGYLAGPLLKFFGFWVTEIILGGLIVAGLVIFWFLSRKPALPQEEREKEPTFAKSPEEKPSLIRKIFAPKFRVKEVEPLPAEKEKIRREPSFALETKPKGIGLAGKLYESPPLDLLNSQTDTPLAGDIRQNAAVIKKTLENFGIPVEMSGINTGPTVTQYTLKPAEGIKLSRITTLSNDLALSLAAHPIRIEAPIPGKSLVGIEIPNKTRAQVRLKELIANSQFQNSSSNLIFVLGRDVSGNPVYADLARMPHLLVAGSTGTGKTIFLNSLILSLLYKNSPEILRLILIDPKRVEFPIYNDLPHLLCPVIFDSQRAVNAFKWLIQEMEKRFEILAAERSRDIMGYNEAVLKNGKEPLPYIVVIVDELADLMAARGKEVEAGIVRLAQMARAVGIHLVVATQRPSVEVITGLIKANITSRVTFQVASQVDSRTVLDAAGAEKLLGQGDLLFISAEIVKPRRIQGAFTSEKEVKKVVNFIKSKVQAPETEAEKEGTLENELADGLEKSLEIPESDLEGLPFGEDPLYEEAKKVVISARKASASLLQRRLRIGYARAARLIDILEERGVVGPGEGAKPREVYFTEKGENNNDEGWQKI